ncbi:MAG: type VI secretion system baseplate subunit TssG [Bacteroidota bacterium]
MEPEARRTSDPLDPEGTGGHGLAGPSSPAVSSEPDEDGFTGVYARLFEEGEQFDFFQAALLLERLFADTPAPGTTPLWSQQRLKFRPHHVMGFPVSDVRSIEWKEHPVPTARITATFLGLYGIDSPLPAPLHEDIALERQEGDVLRAFLDIFNHRLYSYFYRAWKKYRPALNYRPGTVDPHQRRLRALAGLATPGVQADGLGDLFSLLQLTGLGAHLAPQTRNAEGLAVLIQEALGGVPVTVHEHVPRWVTIPERPQMGREGGLQLGVNTTIGLRIHDRAGKFRLEIGPLERKTYLALLPRGEKAAMLKALIRLYVPDYLDFDLEIKLRASDVPPLRLGDQQSQLGLMTCLGTPQDDILSRIVAYPETTGA